MNIMRLCSLCSACEMDCTLREVLEIRRACENSVESPGELLIQYYGTQGNTVADLLFVFVDLQLWSAVDLMLPYGELFCWASFFAFALISLVYCDCQIYVYCLCLKLKLFDARKL